ncbi:MAG: GntR family transcriptional regulator [Tepidisphaeraceae bacterium]
MANKVLSKKLPRNTLRAQLVSKILGSIFSGEVHGGHRLVEEELAIKLGVSRTPVREALGELAAIGLIDLRPNHGAIVRPFGPEQLREIYHVRRILEVEATRMAALRIEPQALADIREETRVLTSQEARGKGWAETALALDQRFHQLISRSSGSERLAEEIGKYRNLVVGVGDAVGNKLHAHDQNMSEHAAIIEHMLAGRADEAGDAMGHHIDRGAETAAEWMRMVYNDRSNGGGKPPR